VGNLEIDLCSTTFVMAMGDLDIVIIIMEEMGIFQKIYRPNVCRIWHNIFIYFMIINFYDLLFLACLMVINVEAPKESLITKLVHGQMWGP